MGLGRYIGKKALWYAGALVAALVLNFILPRLVPGNPVDTIVSSTGSRWQRHRRPAAEDLPVVRLAVRVGQAVVGPVPRLLEQHPARQSRGVVRLVSGERQPSGRPGRPVDSRDPVPEHHHRLDHRQRPRRDRRLQGRPLGQRGVHLVTVPVGHAVLLPVDHSAVLPRTQGRTVPGGRGVLLRAVARFQHAVHHRCHALLLVTVPVAGAGDHRRASGRHAIDGHLRVRAPTT